MNYSEDLMHIAMTANRAYAGHCSVVIDSLIHCHPNRPICFHFIHDSLEGGAEPDYLDTLRSFARSLGAQFNVVVVPPEWGARLPPHPIFGFHAWLRLLLPELLPELPRILYLDADIVVNDSLESLWAIDFRGALLAAVFNPLYSHQSDAWIYGLGLRSSQLYFNSGVLMLDLAALRLGGWTEMMLRYVNDQDSPLLYPDQDTLNALLWRNWLPLPPRYNAQTQYFNGWTAPLPHSREELKELHRRPAIVHFTGHDKPWLHACRNPWRELYWKHLRRTPWRDLQPMYPHWSNPLLRILPFPVYRRIVRWFDRKELIREPAQRF